MADGLFGGFGDWLGSLFSSGGPATGPSVDLSSVYPTGFSASAPVTTPDVTAPTGGGGGGFSLSGLNDVLRGVAPAVGLASTGVGIGAGIYNTVQGAQQRAMLEREQKRQAQLAAPAAAAGSALTGAGAQAMLGGALPPQLESQVDQWKTQARAQIRDYLAKAGISDSTMAAQFESWIDMQANTLRSQLAQNLLQSGYAGVTTALGPSAQVSSTASGLMGGTAELLAAANKSIAALLGQTGGA